MIALLPNLFGTPSNSAPAQPGMSEVDNLLAQTNLIVNQASLWASQAEQQQQRQDAYMMQQVSPQTQTAFNTLGSGPSLGGAGLPFHLVNGQASFDSNTFLNNILQAQNHFMGGGQTIPMSTPPLPATFQGQNNIVSFRRSSPPATTHVDKPRKPTPKGGLSASQKKVIDGPKDKNGNPILENLGIGKQHKLHPQAAKAFKAANKEFRKKTGYNIPLVSSYRSPAHNAKIGGSKTSNHMKGASIDLNRVALQQKTHYDEAISILRKYGFEPLDGVSYSKKGVLQGEDNHLDFVGVDNVSNDWHGPKFQ